jgi:hypothetical protein
MELGPDTSIGPMGLMVQFGGMTRGQAEAAFQLSPTMDFERRRL